MFIGVEVKGTRYMINLTQVEYITGVADGPSQEPKAVFFFHSGRNIVSDMPFSKFEQGMAQPPQPSNIVVPTRAPQ